MFYFHLSWNKNKTFWTFWKKANKLFHSCWALYFFPHPFPKQPKVKIPFLNSRTIAQLLLPPWSTSKLLNCTLSSCVGFLNLFYISLQYISVAKKWHFWMKKDSLNNFFFYLFYFPQPEAVCIVTLTAGKIQRHEMSPLTRCQRTTVIQHIIWADMHVSFFCKKHLALKKKSLKVENKGLNNELNFICKPLKRDRVTAHHFPFLQTPGMAITPHDLEVFFS